jgi:hypothetical protein
MDAAATSEDSKQIFLALGQHFAVQGQLDLFATQILNSLRGDSRPQLGYRIDNLLDCWGVCPESVARSPPGTGHGRSGRPGMFVQRKSSQAHRNDSAGP